MGRRVGTRVQIEEVGNRKNVSTFFFFFFLKVNGAAHSRGYTVKLKLFSLRLGCLD